MTEKIVRIPVGDKAPTGRLLYGIDVRDGLRLLGPESVHCVVTSPPYWGLRDYGVDGQVGLEDTPDEYVEALVSVFREVKRVLRTDGVAWLNLGDSYCGGGRAGTNPEYQEKHTTFGKTAPKEEHGKYGVPQAVPAGLKAKDLALVPFRVVLALQADGWWVRSVMPWVKANVMPENCLDRPTTAHEYWFMLTRSASYFYDIDAVRKPHTAFQRRYSKPTMEHGNGVDYRDLAGGRPRNRSGKALAYAYGEPGVLSPAGHVGGRNRRTSDPWVESLEVVIAEQEAYLAHLKEVQKAGLLTSEDGVPLGIRATTTPYRGSHFACFPPKLIEPLISASTSERGCCPTCGAQWTRQVERGPKAPEPEHRNPTKRLIPGQPGNVGSGNMGFRASNLSGVEMSEWKDAHPDKTVGWEAGCTCEGNTGQSRAVVLDPFSGSATTGMVAMSMGRNYVGTDLNGAYLALAEARILGSAPPDPKSAGRGDEGSALDLFGDSD